MEKAKHENILFKLYNMTIFWPLMCLICIIFINFIINPGFLKIEMKDGHLFGSLIDILNRASPLILISLGMTLVIAVQGIDISVGSIIAISACVSATVIVSNGPVILAIAAGIFAGLLCGFWNGFLVAYIGVQPMVGTLILYIVGRGIAQLITDGKILTFSNESFIFLGTGFLLIPIPVYIAMAVTLIMYLIIRKTSLGLFIEAIGVNREASRFSGINSTKVIFALYAICGLLAGLAGLIICANIKSADANNAGQWLELDAILSVVIGGTSMSGGRFYLGGTVVGALFIQSLTTTIHSIGVPPEVTLVVKAIVVISVVLIQSPIFRNMLSRKNVFRNFKTKKVAEL